MILRLRHPLRGEVVAAFVVLKQGHGLDWIEELTAMARGWPGWRSEEERRAIFDQFGQVAAVYERLNVVAEGTSR